MFYSIIIVIINVWGEFMTVVPNSKVEDKAISILQDFIANNFNMKEQLKKGEKGFSVDGVLQVFNGTPDKKDNFVGEVQTQVKGKSLKSDKHLDKIKYPISRKDLENYYKYNGIIFFVVLIDWETSINTIYYKVLLPLNLKILLDKNNNKSQTVEFDKLVNSKKLEIICRSFISDQEKQISFKPLLLSNFEMENIPLIFYHIIGENDELENIVNEEKTIYKKVVVNGQEMDFPLTIAKITYMGQDKLKKPIKVKNKTFYDYVERNDNESFKFGNTIIFNIIKHNMEIEINGNLKQAIRDYEFLLAMIDSNSFCVDNIEIDLSNQKEVDISEIERNLKYLKSIHYTLNSLGIDKELNIHNLTVEECQTLENMIYAYEYKYGFSIPEYNNQALVFSNFKFGDINIVLLGTLNNENKRYYYEDIFDLNKVGDSELIISNNFLKKERSSDNSYFIVGEIPQLMHCDNFKHDKFLTALTLMSKNEDNYEITRYIIITFLNEYKKSSDSTLLDLAINVSKWLMKKKINNSDYIYYTICKKLKSKLSKLEKDKLIKLIDTEDDNIIKHICYLLLDNKKKADELTFLFTNDQKEDIKNSILISYSSLNSIEKMV